MEEYDRLDAKAAWKDDLGVLSSCIREYIHPPAALASGHRGVAHKAGCEVFKWHLSVDPSITLIEHASVHMVHASDFGTKFGIPKFKTDNPERLLPPWIHRGKLELDIEEMSEEDHDANSECIDSKSVVSEVEWPELQSDQAAAVDDDVGDFDGESDDDNDTVPDLLPICLNVPGLCHIIDNMLRDVHESMDYWNEFQPILKQFEALLRSEERRKRIVITCCTGNFSHYAGKFSSWSASLYEARWHEVVNFLQKLIPYCQCWYWFGTSGSTRRL